MPSEQESASPNEMQPRSSGRRAIAIVVALVLLLACLLGIKPGLAAWARWMAASQLRSGAISEAQRWLNWSDWFSPDVAETERMRAVCFRLLGQMKRWEESLKRAQKAGLARKRLERELTLGRVRQGVHEDGEAALSRLSPNDRLPWESTAVLVRYYLNRNQPDRAKRLLQKAEDELPHEPHITYLWGVYWYDQGDEARALQKFRQTVLAQPRHELALSAWAKLLE
ncbi:MAG: hypothetical protein GXP27_06035, partial [Planctomycetes bacterium]|nr:hypothetical protein [Planctomycetota bacterium]